MMTMRMMRDDDDDDEEINLNCQTPVTCVSVLRATIAMVLKLHFLGNAFFLNMQCSCTVLNCSILKKGLGLLFFTLQWIF